MSLSNHLANTLLKDLGKLSEVKQRGWILDRHFETIKKHVKAGNSVAEERWDSIERAWGLKETGVFDEEEWVMQLDGETQHVTSSTRLSFSSQPDAGSKQGAPSQQPPAAAARAAGTARVVDRGKEAREKAARGTLGGNILNAFAIGSGQPVSHENSILNSPLFLLAARQYRMHRDTLQEFLGVTLLYCCNYSSQLQQYCSSSRTRRTQIHLNVDSDSRVHTVHLEFFFGYRSSIFLV